MKQIQAVIAQTVIAMSWVFFLGSSAQAKLVLSTAFGKEVKECHATLAKKHVWVFKQWHLPSAINTTKPAAQPFPQRENQTAIYKQLESWIEKGGLKLVLAEGCSGTIDSNFKPEINGWSVKTLEAATNRNDYSDLLTSVPMKLKAKYKTKTDVICAEDDKLVRANALAFSDARGTLGFYNRLTQYKNEPKYAKTYLDGAIEAFKMPKNTTMDQARTRLRAELKKTVARIKETLKERNQKITENIKRSKESELALVIGGAHASDLFAQLEKAGLGCTFVEPTGYFDDSEKMMSDLEKLVNAI